MFAKPQPRLCPIFLSLFISLVSFAMENQSGYNEKKPIQKKVFYIPSNTFDNQNNKEKSILDQFMGNIKEFDEDDISNMNQMFNNSPKEAQNIVKHLKNRNFLCDGSYRSTMFYGMPGSGKTTMSKAIAYKMATEVQWKYAVIPSTKFLKEYRNQTAVYLNNLFDEITIRDEPFILIIDELNQLLENADSKHHDCDATSKVIWSFLDSRKNKHNFFFIGTMNRINKLPQPFKSRILFRCIEFGPFANLTQKNELFRKKLLCDFVRLDVADDVLNVELQKIHNCTGRDLEEFASALKRAFRNHDDQSEIMVIGKVHIDEVIERYLKTYTFAEYDKKDETDEERSERHHQENITNQNTNHRETITKQKKHHKKNIKNQNRNHREIINNQNAHHREGQYNQNTQHRENVLLSLFNNI